MGGIPCGAAGALVEKEGGAAGDDASSGYGSPPDPDVCDSAR